MLNIKYGNPYYEPASYTRFILPFAYHPQKRSKISGNGYYYEKFSPEEQIWRERYLTYEIADVLFRRAKWFRFTSKNAFSEIPMAFRDCQEGKELKVNIVQPTIVLFEWPVDTKNDPQILQTGFLIVELNFSLSNNDCPSLDNLLEMNELFRYWRQPFEGHENLSRPSTKGYRTLLKNVSYRIGEKETIAQKTDPLDDIYFERWASLLEIPVKIENEVGAVEYWDLFPDRWGTNAREYVRSNDSNSETWAIYADNRTFVWTCAVIDGGGKALRDRFALPQRPAWDFGHWVKLLNVDRPGDNCETSHLCTDFEKKWAEERTYKRWQEGGTFYGFSYHSGAMLGPPDKDLRLWKHFGQMYFDQVLLLLFIRVTLFRFSMKLNGISSKLLDSREEQEEWGKDFEGLRQYFTYFTNLYQFPLLSNQQQGIEMYTIARQAMDVDELFNEIQKEINGSHEYLSIIEEKNQAVKMKEQSDRMERLTYTATVGLAMALTLGFWSMDIIVDWLKKFQLYGLQPREGLMLIISFIVFAVIVWLLISWEIGFNWFKKRLSRK